MANVTLWWRWCSCDNHDTGLVTMTLLWQMWHCYDNYELAVRTMTLLLRNLWHCYESCDTGMTALTPLWQLLCRRDYHPSTGGHIFWRVHTARESNLVCFPVSVVYFFDGGDQHIAKLDGDHGRIIPLDPPLTTITLLNHNVYFYLLVN